MILTASKRRRPIRPNAWRLFRARYEEHAVAANWSRLDLALWRNVADDVERLIAPRELGDVDDERLAALLLADGCDRVSVAISLDLLKCARDWVGAMGLVDADPQAVANRRIPRLARYD